MSKNAIIAIVAAIIVIGGGIGAYIFMGKDKDGGNTADNSSKVADNTTPAKKYTDACKLFSREQMDTALGGTFGGGEEGISFTTATPGTPDYDNEDLRGSSCNFDQEDDGTTASMAASMRLSVDIKTYKDVATASSYMSSLHSPVTAEGQEAVVESVDVSGVGDQAFFSVLDVAEQSKNESLNVLVGRQVVVLTVTQLSGLDQAAVRAGLTELAKNL